MKILGDNETSLNLTRDLESQNCTKYIDEIHHHIRKLVENGEISSTDILADGFTKAFAAGPFKKHRGKWGLIA